MTKAAEKVTEAKTAVAEKFKKAEPKPVVVDEVPEDKPEPKRSDALKITFELALSPFADSGETDEQIAELARASVAKHFPLTNFKYEGVKAKSDKDEAGNVLVPNHQAEYAAAHEDDNK